jgi:hypothetical protein
VPFKQSIPDGVRIFANGSAREMIGIPVHMKKYAPFVFQIIRGEDGTPKVTVE